MKYLLVASGDRAACESLSHCFRTEYQIDIAFAGKSALSLLQKRRYELLFLDISVLQELGTDSGQVDYARILTRIRELVPSVQVIVLCSPKMVRTAVDAVRAGAGNYLTFPIDPDEARYIVDSTLEGVRMEYELNYLRDQFWHQESLEFVKTHNAGMRQVLDKVKTVAATDTTVLISGETGTGKGVLARLIHNHSRRKDKQFISVHCGAIPDNLLESELFGHERGAFTGAVKRRLGKFEIAQSGTIFLDEIGTMPLSAQIKLLQVLQDRVFQRVGGEDSIRCDVRVIAASNVDLAEMTESNTFRKDLFYRLNVFPIELPPLRERREDLPLFIEAFLKKLDRSYAKNISSVSSEVLAAFEAYEWPGNIRELENLLERAYLLESGQVVSVGSIPHELLGLVTLSSAVMLNTALCLGEVRRKAICDVEERYLREQLAAQKGKIQATARAADITTRQLHKLLTRYRIRKEEYKINK